jgi:folate-binding protein YgfZ
MEEPSHPTYLGRVRVSGADAETFLQGQLTQDIRTVQRSPALAGYCSPKGRLLAVMEIRRVEEGFELEMHHGVYQSTLRRLRMFVLRSKVALDEIPAATDCPETEWRRRNILAGIPVIYPETSDHFVPQMVNLDRLGAISFNKGCYTGQEIVARLHYLGNLKRRMYLLRGKGPVTPPGSALFSGTQSQAAGEVVDCVQMGAATCTSAVLHCPPAVAPFHAEAPSAFVAERVSEYPAGPAS